MQFASFDGITIHFQHIAGPSDAPVLVFSNSLATDFRIWRDVVVQLAGKYHMLMYDKRGHGLSDIGNSPYQLDDHVRDLEHLLDHHDINHAFICGLSVGGMIAQRLYERQPDRVAGLILCDTAPRIGTDEIWNERMDLVTKGGMKSLIGANMKRWFTQNFHDHHKPALAGYSNMFLRTPVEGYLGTATVLRDADLTDAASKIAVPTICVVGEDDGSTSPELVLTMANLIPGADFKLIKGAGHIPCVEQPHILADIIADFIQTHHKTDA